MGVPELRRAFERIEQKVLEVQGDNKETQIAKMKEAWKSIFHKEIDTKAVEAYLAVKMSSLRRGNKKTRKDKGKKQSGGMAPVDYQLRPGIDGVYGSFQNYVVGGLPYPEIGRTQEWGTKDFTPILPADMGSNQAGGGVVDALLYKPFDSTSPPTLYQDIRSMYLGNPSPPSSAVENKIWNYKN